MKSSWTTGSTLLALLLTFAAAFSVQASVGFTPADEQGRTNYLITFAEPGLLQQHQQRATGQRFDFNAPSMVSAREQLQAQQAQHLSRMANTLGRNVEPSHFYLVTHSGVAARLSQEEARRVRALPGVVNIERERVYELSTYRGPTFIGADGVWTGAATPSGDGFEGRGMIAAILDTGIVPSHASFINDPACGHGAEFPNKVLSNLDCASTDGSGLCNGGNPVDTNGHGSHTAGTVAGNRVQPGASPSPTIPAPYTEISGVAPCAHVRSYKTCPGQSCPGADLQAGLNSVLIHGDVDAVNYSISGGSSPWSDFDRVKLDMVDEGIFVAASAGNTSTSIPNPVGQVNHRGPWVMSVAASTRDGSFSGEVTVDGNTYAADPGSDSPVGGNLISHPIRYDAGQPAGADGCDGFPANFFDGAIALIQRGTCPFSDKINNAAAAGADMVLIWNNAAGAFGMSTPGQDPNTPAYSITQAAGNAIRSYIDAQGSSAVATFEAVPSQGDVLAGFSFRGPTPGALANLQKPDITAPGVDIYAAIPGGYGNSSGTSMSGPHVAGAGLLVAQVRPDWTPSEIKSAIQMTASKAGTKENGTTPWDWDDVGSGRADLMGAALAGFVLDETFANYLAANPAAGGDVRTLNLAAVRDMDCSPSCTWTRTVRNTLDEPSNWTATGAGITANMNIEVSPSSFSFNGTPGETQVLTITAAPVDDLSSTIGFGEIVFEETGALSPDLHFTVAIRGEPAEFDVPVIEVDQDQFFFVMNPDDSSSQTLTISNVGSQPLEWEITEAELASFGRGSYNPDIDEVLSLDDFLLPGNGSYDATATGGVSSSGEVIGFTFQGTVAGISGTSTWASDMQLNMTSPDGQTFQVGGFLGDNPWDFDGSGSTDDGTYSSTHLDAFMDAPDAGSWQFNFVHTWNDAMNWSDVTVTLHKMGASGPCADPSDIPWLSVIPASGTTAPSDSDGVDVVVDSTGLAEGNYDALLCLTSNDPNTGLIEIPVNLSVVDGTIEPASIDVDTASFSFDLTSGDSDSDGMVISNLGDEVLSWFIDTADGPAAMPAVRAAHYQPNQNSVRSSGRMPVLSTGTGVELFAEDLAALSRPMGTPVPTLSVDGMTSEGLFGSGNPFNSSLTLAIGAGNEVIGLGWEVTIETNGGSWLSEAGVAIVPTSSDTTGLFLRPGVGNDGPGTITSSSQGVLIFDDAGIPPIPASVDGTIYLEWYETFSDGENPDAFWFDSASPEVLPPGLRLVCTDQAACDAAIGGGPMPEGCDAPSEIEWLSVAPSSGLLTGGNSANVTVSVDATGLAGGSYEALLCVNSNDAANPIIEIPVSMDVTGPAEIDVDPTSISMTLEQGDSDTAALLVGNVGQSVLDWEVDESGTAGTLLRVGDTVTIPASINAQASAGLVAASSGPQGASGPFNLNGSGTTITHSNSTSVVTGTVACSPDSGSTTSENYFLRTFTLDDFGITDAFNVTEVAFGIENLSASQPITVNLYSLDGAFTYANMELVGSATESLASQQLTVVNVPVAGSIAAGGTLVVEIAPPDLSGAAAFFPGSNSAGETAPSYIASPACSINEPATYASIGFGTVHLVMSVTGTVGAGACELPSWMSVNPLSGSVAPGDDEAVAVTLDATGLDFGTYEATICIASNDPFNPLVQVPVSLEVPLGENAAILEGTVSSLGYCSADPFAAAGALIEVEGDSGAIYTATADGDGFYSLVLDVNESPVSVIASAPDHTSATEAGVTLIAQDTVTVDFDLVLEAACATVSPEDFVDVVAEGASASYTLTIGNLDGAAALNWDIEVDGPLNGYEYGLAGADALVSTTGFDRASGQSGGERSVNPAIVQHAIQGGPVEGDWSEGFDDITLLPGAGWSLQNQSSPLGISDWFQGNPESFPAHEGAPNSYIGANFNNTTGGTGIISNWMLTPEMVLQNGTELRFWTRTPAGSSWADRLEVRLSTSGASTDVGAGATDVGDFDVMLLSINENQVADGYPQEWTEFVVEVEGLAAPTSGRLAFRYHVTDAGPSGANSNYIGIDTVSVTQPVATSCVDPEAVPWLSVDLLSGTVAAGDSVEVSVLVDGAELAPGLNEGFLCVNTDDANAGLFVVPVSINNLVDTLFQDRFEE